MRIAENLGAARKVFNSSLVAENNTTSLFTIISYCFTVRVSDQLAFRVRRAVT